MEELTEELVLLTTEDITPQQTQTSELVDSKEDLNLYWEIDDANPNQVIYDLENNETIIPMSEEEIILPFQPTEKLISRNVSSRRRNNR